MTVIVAYDVGTTTPAGRRRLRKVAQHCENFGIRVQKSIFECVLREQDWVLLKAGLLGEYEAKEDSLRFYFLDEAGRKKTEHYGISKPLDVDGTLIA